LDKVAVTLWTQSVHWITAKLQFPNGFPVAGHRPLAGIYPGPIRHRAERQQMSSQWLHSLGPDHETAAGLRMGGGFWSRESRPVRLQIGQHCGSQRQGPRFNSRLGSLSVWSLHVLPLSAWVSSGCSGFLPQSKDVWVR